MSEHATQTDQTPDDRDHDLVDHLISYKRLDPDSDAATQAEAIRELFKQAGHMLVDNAKRTPDRTIAIRDIHRACMSSIAALVLNAD